LYKRNEVTKTKAVVTARSESSLFNPRSTHWCGLQALKLFLRCRFLLPCALHRLMRNCECPKAS